MEKLHSVQIPVNGTVKEISVYCADITAFDLPIDILTTSAFVGSYSPTPRTIFYALNTMGIHVQSLAKDPAFDLRNPCHVWLSKEIPAGDYPAQRNVFSHLMHTAAPKRPRIRRIGCVELIGGHLAHMDAYEAEQTMINSIRSYFHMLDIASLYGVRTETVALPLLGGGNQNISGELLLVPLINECIQFLKRNPSVRQIYFIDRNPAKAELIARSLRNSLRFFGQTNDFEAKPAKNELAFISYSSKDKNIADNLCAKLEQKGIKVWYAPRDVQGPYASSIVSAIDKATYFIVVLSQNSLASEHVLNEIDLAFQNLSHGLKFKPLRIDNAMFTASFKYYLSRQHWMDASVPPLEERLQEFVGEIVRETNAQ